MKKVNIMKVLLISILFILSCKVSYCAEGTVRMQIVGEGAVWANISVSESYAECEKLNSSTSTLGTSALRAHLTTDADWSAMAIFSVSQYGGATSNMPTQTNGNKSGLHGLGNDHRYYQTTGLLETATSTSNAYISGLFDGNNVKQYIKKWSTDRESTNFVGFTDTWGWYSSNQGWGTSNSMPVSIKRGLFGVLLGNDGYWGNTSGKPHGDTTFRPVIWN